ncbi:MAG: biotin/lipoate A/B protein ligase family protein [Thermoguttaceae bacterium]|jgi:lipoate-protein ligase A
MIDSGRCRLLRHAPESGAWNMAVDEMLLERAEEQATACLRFYRWSKPTLSLGYFQTYADRLEHPTSLTCAVVRRLTGGGAILHDAELTYSIILPSTHPLAGRRDELYQSIHGCLIETFKRLGITARLCEKAGKSGASREPFLCFQRRSPGDVLIGRTKICGSAQRRRNGVVLQHGSLLWRTSPAAPELPGVGDVVTHPIELESVADLWLSGLSGRLGLSWHSDDLDETEVHRAEALVESRYAGQNWTKNRRTVVKKRFDAADGF